MAADLMAPNMKIANVFSLDQTPISVIGATNAAGDIERPADAVFVQNGSSMHISGVRHISKREAHERGIVTHREGLSRQMSSDSSFHACHQGWKHERLTLRPRLSSASGWPSWVLGR